jgi:hypothetical protein
MTSLGLLQYSEINDNSTINSNITELEKKRQARHNITIKKRHTIDENMTSAGASSSANGNSDNVQNMLKLINNSNGYDNLGDDSGLVDFNPPPRAEVSSKEPFDQGVSEAGQASDTSQTSQAARASEAARAGQQKNNVSVDYEKPNTVIHPQRAAENNNTVAPRQYPMPLDSHEGFNSLPKTYAQDYYKQYVPFFNQMEPSSTNKDQLLEKLNYMIYLLEEQKDEKTGHVMEEIILYSFLGVFIIFIVDSFARAGKYTR